MVFTEVSIITTEMKLTKFITVIITQETDEALFITLKVSFYRRV